jgi:hypothetical protein
MSAAAQRRKSAGRATHRRDPTRHPRRASLNRLPRARCRRSGRAAPPPRRDGDEYHRRVSGTGGGHGLGRGRTESRGLAPALAVHPVDGAWQSARLRTISATMSASGGGRTRTLPTASRACERLSQVGPRVVAIRTEEER